MANSDFVFNIAKGKIVYYAGLPAASDNLVVVLLKSSGLEADATLMDYDDLSALLAGTSDELTDGSYARKAVSSVTGTTPDDTNDRVDIDIADQVWTALAGAAVGKLIICYNPDTGTNGSLGTGHESSLIPLTGHAFLVTPDGSDVTAAITGFARCA